MSGATWRACRGKWRSWRLWFCISRWICQSIVYLSFSPWNKSSNRMWYWVFFFPSLIRLRMHSLFFACWRHPYQLFLVLLHALLEGTGVWVMMCARSPSIARLFQALWRRWWWLFFFWGVALWIVCKGSIGCHLFRLRLIVAGDRDGVVLDLTFSRYPRIFPFLSLGF